MKKWIIALSMCTLLTYSILTIPVEASEQTILLPDDDVDARMIVEYDTGVQSWFVITLLGIPAGYDVTNQEYPGWCIQKDLAMKPGVNHSVVLYSSLDGSLPVVFQSMPWQKINYIINHRDGYTKYSVQNAIWCFTDNASCSDDPDVQALVNAANDDNGSFIPTTGDILAIPIKGISTIQLSFLELVIPPPNTLQGLVWYDNNGNGVQNGGELGINDVTVTVHLYTESDVLVSQTQTNPEGLYTFGSVNPGDYYLRFTLPSGYKFSPKDIGDDAFDSDANTSTGKTDIFSIITNNVTITIWDAGMYVQSSGEKPVPPHQPTPVNKRPTADATAGEPYRGFINSAITFNGSRSYDLDGQIITWRWSFGDGTNGTGEVTSHTYTLPGNYTVTLLVTDNKFATDLYTTTARITLGNNPPGTPVVLGPAFGHVGASYQYTVVSTDPDGDNLRYVINWGDGLQNTSPPVESGNSIQTTHQWNSVGFYEVQVYAQDTYNATSETSTLTIPIDVQYAQNLGYFIDENSDGVYDRFHTNGTGIETAVDIQQNTENYLIDTNGDGSWDMTYDPASGQTQQYNEQSIFQYGIIVLVILVIAFILVYFVVRHRRRSKTISKNQNTMDDTKRP